MPCDKDKPVYTSDTLDIVEAAHDKYFGANFRKHPSKRIWPELNAKGLACMKDILQSLPHFNRAILCTPEEARERAKRTIKHLEEQLKYGPR